MKNYPTSLILVKFWYNLKGCHQGLFFTDLRLAKSYIKQYEADTILVSQNKMHPDVLWTRLSENIFASSDSNFSKTEIGDSIELTVVIKEPNLWGRKCFKIREILDLDSWW